MQARKQGFTLLELLVSLVVIGAVSAVAIPNYYNAIEKGRLNEARVNLAAIHAGEKLYKAKTGGYWGPGATNITNINTQLNLDIATQNYTDGLYVAGDANGYQARVQRSGAGATYMIDQTGVFRKYSAGTSTGGGSTGSSCSEPNPKDPSCKGG